MLYGTYLTLNHFDSVGAGLKIPYHLPPISILKPLKGVDEGLEENLVSFFELEYPDFELIFSVGDSSDPVCDLVRDLIGSYPNIRARIITEAVQIGMNPKVNNLVHSYNEALFDWLLISDSNVRVEKRYLKRLTAQIRPDVGLITSVVSGHSPQGVGGYLEAIYLNTFYARGMFLAERFHRTAAIGKSMLFRRSTANRFGGIQILARYLAEDYMAGEAMVRLGLKVIIAADPICQYIGQYSFRDFWMRHLRWGRIRKAQVPLAFLIEPVVGSVVSFLFGCWSLGFLFGISPLFVMIFHFSVWGASDLLIQKRLKAELGPRWLGCWILRELLALPLWISIAMGSTVTWRGREFTLETGGILR